MKLSIIIVSYNTKDLTLDCINSVFKFAPKIKFEVVVVDNGSSDGTVESLPKSVKVIKNNANLGFSRANNQGIKISKGKYILLLNSDTKVTKGAIEKLISFAENADGAGVVGSQLLNADGSIQPSVFYLPTLGRTIAEFWLKGKKYLEKYAPQGSEPAEVEAVVGAAFLITPKAQKRVGQLNEAYFMYFEDLDYCREVRRKGLKVYYLPSSKIYHYHGASGKGIADASNQWKRLIPSSKTYHGLIKYYAIQFMMKTSQKLLK